MGEVNTSRSPVSYPTLIGSTVCLFLGLLFIYWAETPFLPKWLLLFLLAVPTGLVLLYQGCLFFSGRKCASCGFHSYDRLCDFDPCPHCEGLFGNVASLLPQETILHLREYLAETRDGAKIIGMILAMAIRDGANEFRLEGREEEGESEYPDEEPGRSWRVWLTVKGKSYEIVPPPRHLGAEAYRLLREIHRQTTIDAASGPACFQIAIDDYSESVELMVEESEEEELAKILFTSESLEPWPGMQPYLTEIFERTAL